MEGEQAQIVSDWRIIFGKSLYFPLAIHGTMLTTKNGKGSFKELI